MSRPINRWRSQVSYPQIIVTPKGEAIFAALWDDYRAARAKPVTLLSLPAIMGHTRPLGAHPVVLQ